MKKQFWNVRSLVQDFKVRKGQDWEILPYSAACPFLRAESEWALGGDRTVKRPLTVFPQTGIRVVI